MAVEWNKLLRSSDVRVVDGTADVPLGHRRHRVEIIEEEDAYRFVAIVAHTAAVARMSGPSLFAWRRNRSSRLVGFRVDRKGRLIGEAWAPKAGLTAAEFQLQLRAVATESDRLEQVLTGRDVE